MNKLEEKGFTDEKKKKKGMKKERQLPIKYLLPSKY